MHSNSSHELTSVLYSHAWNANPQRMFLWGKRYRCDGKCTKLPPWEAVRDQSQGCGPEKN